MDCQAIGCGDWLGWSGRPGGRAAGADALAGQVADVRGARERQHVVLGGSAA